MTSVFWQQLISALLSVALALGSAGGGSDQKPADGGMSSAAEASLGLLHQDMAYSDQIAGAVAYLGYREPGDTIPLSNWMQDTCSGLTTAMPFLLEIPEERILGAGYGDLYCIVPRDENTSLAVNRVKWETVDYGVWPVAGEVLYREEYGQPVLVFVNFEQWHDEPDTEIVLVTNDGVEVSWCPVVDAYGITDIPVGEDYTPVLMDFAIWGITTGLDYPEGWVPSEDGWWLPPTDWGLAYTSWVCDHWSMDFSWGDSDIAYSGIVNLYYQAETGQEYALAYSGVWRMEDDCLRLELSDGAGNSVNGSFPVLIDPSGEYLHIQQDRDTHICPPFFDEGVTAMELTLVYG